ncbi:hypothetical protein U9M48_004283 [Paspalum notatum var. saurae]|uniref:Uncharacterized protein n=1 Tax=Paspalum notatum var. saurae TaxID=547442 RepID=A0AAQ3PPR7_PASNO
MPRDVASPRIRYPTTPHRRRSTPSSQCCPGHGAAIHTIRGTAVCTPPYAPVSLALGFPVGASLSAAVRTSPVSVRNLLAPPFAPVSWIWTSASSSRVSSYALMFVATGGSSKRDTIVVLTGCSACKGANQVARFGYLFKAVYINCCICSSLYITDTSLLVYFNAARYLNMASRETSGPHDKGDSHVLPAIVPTIFYICKGNWVGSLMQQELISSFKEALSA